MTCHIHHHVRVVAQSQNTNVDTVADALPPSDAEGVVVHRVSRTAEPDADTERLTARVAFDTEAESDASALYDALTEVAAERDELVHYRSPIGGVLASDVQAWYREHPDERPTDDKGEAFIPSSWDPTRHVVAEW